MLIPVKDHALGQKSISERIEKFVIPLSSFVVIPLFVLANAGVRFSTATLTDATISIGLGIVGGLVVGKVLGIVGTTWILVKMRIVNLPRDTSWRQIIGVGFIAGIGFTVSLFVAELSFTDDTLTNFAKISVFAGSILSALIGLLILRRGRKARLNS
jgi:NhaA family Na+:H+ antiporter